MQHTYLQAYSLALSLLDSPCTYHSLERLSFESMPKVMTKGVSGFHLGSSNRYLQNLLTSPKHGSRLKLDPLLTSIDRTALPSHSPGASMLQPSLSRLPLLTVGDWKVFPKHLSVDRDRVLSLTYVCGKQDTTDMCIDSL
jgi:hypothetical protein